MDICIWDEGSFEDQPLKGRTKTCLLKKKSISTAKKRLNKIFDFFSYLVKIFVQNLVILKVMFSILVLDPPFVNEKPFSSFKLKSERSSFSFYGILQ